MASNGYSNENNNGNHTEDVTFATRVHEGFWTLFQFSEEVLYRSNELKKSAFALHEEGQEEEQQQNRQEADVPSLQYLGLHHRQGDWTIPSVKDTIHRATLKRRHIHYSSLLECCEVFKKVFPDGITSAYLASDDAYNKNKLSLLDSTIKVATDMTIFHIDKSMRSGSSKNVSSITKAETYRGVLDGWAELSVLVDADCLVVSNSMFSAMAYYIRGDQGQCNTHVLECKEEIVRQVSHSYTYESGDNSLKKIKKNDKTEAMEMETTTYRDSDDRSRHGSISSSNPQQLQQPLQQDRNQVINIAHVINLYDSHNNADAMITQQLVTEKDPADHVEIATTTAMIMATLTSS